MYTDMVGYTALSQTNESLSLDLVDKQRKLIRPILNRHNGREIKTMGDSSLVEFASALDAVRCAYAIQKTVREINTSAPIDHRLHIRIGVHLGDIIESESDISGDAVNVASRIEPLAEEGGVCLSRQVYDNVQNKFELPLTSLGLKSLKNVTEPLEVYKVVMPWDATRIVQTEHDTRRIAILPFANISPDPADEYFSDGMADELISVLSKIKGLRVVARTSAMRFKGEKATAGRIGQELKVGSLIEGSVRKAKNRVRITVQLVDTQSEEQLWTDTYDRDLEDIFSVQSDIAHQVAKALELQLGVRDSSALRREQTQNPEAYSLYLKGRHHWNLRSENDVNRAMKYFEEAIGRDSQYAPAYVGLADCYSVLGTYGYRRGFVVYPRAKELAEKALSLDESLAEAHASLGETLMWYYYDWTRAGLEFDKALELNPSYATAHMWRATHHTALGRFNDALIEAKRAVELDPLSMIVLTDAAKDLYLARRYDEAISEYRKSLQVDPEFPIAHKGLAEVYSQKGMHDQAIKEIERAIALSERSIFILDDLGYIYARGGKREDATKVLEDLTKLASDHYVSAYGRAVIYAALDEKEKAIAWLEKAYEERSFLVYLKVDPAFDPLRKEERFAILLGKLDL
jgi:adenylate cyclase